MGLIKHICLVVTAAIIAVACAPESDDYNVNRYLCNFEGAYWDSLVDTNPNGDNLLNDSIPTAWHDESSDLMGEVSQPFEGYWEGIALSNHCSKDCKNDGTYDKQLVAYVEGAYSGKNFIICNNFLGNPATLRFKSKRSFIESVMVANTTYSRNVTANGYRTAEEALGSDKSIWIEARGYINSSDEVQATAKFFLYENGKPSFEGWKKWYMSSMCKVDRVEFSIEWDGEGFNQYPAYFALDDIMVVRQELR